MSFFEMGGYAAYVWPAFGAAAAIMVALLVLSIRTMRAREAALRTLEASARRRRAAEGDGDRDGEQNAPA
jgi:heme exporter protein D